MGESVRDSPHQPPAVAAPAPPATASTEPCPNPTQSTARPTHNKPPPAPSPDRLQTSAADVFWGDSRSAPSDDDGQLELLDWGSIHDEDGAYGQSGLARAAIDGADLGGAEGQVDRKGKGKAPAFTSPAPSYGGPRPFNANLDSHAQLGTGNGGDPVAPEACPGGAPSFEAADGDPSTAADGVRAGAAAPVDGDKTEAPAITASSTPTDGQQVQHRRTGTTSIDFSLAQLIQVIILLGTGGANGGGYMASKYVLLAIYAVILVLHGLINCLPIQWLSWFGHIGVFWNTAGVFVLVILFPAIAKERASVEFIFTHFNTDNGMGIHSKVYILAVGLLMSQYSLLGYDTSAHMSEETKGADRSGPIGIVTAVALASMFGWIYLVAVTSLMTDIPYLLSPANDAGGYAVAQALYTAFHGRYGSGAGAIACLAFIAVAVFLCGIACVTTNSRMGYAFSRDGAMPFSRVWYRLNSHEVPINVVWLSVTVAFIMSLTSLGSQVAFQAMVSVATTGLYIAYALPIFFRVTTSRKTFVPGPFHLGRYGLAVGWVAVAWVALVTVLFCLPVAYPVAEDNLNYTPVAVGGVLILSVGAWLLHARFWFEGPVINVDVDV